MRAAISFRVLLAGSALVLAGIPAAHACGACIEDKVAATFDYAVVNKAAQHGQVVVFAQVSGPADARTFEALRKAAARTRGVDASSLRTSLEPAAVSFALDRRAASAQETLAALGRTAGMRLLLLRTM